MNCCSGYFNRGFQTREEKIEALNSYKAELDKESQGVQEIIAQLTKED